MITTYNELYKFMEESNDIGDDALAILHELDETGSVVTQASLNEILVGVYNRLDDAPVSIAEIGENIVARRNMTWTVQGTGAIAAYVHLGGKLGVMVEVGCNDAASVAKPEVKAMLSDLTLHITAVAPVCIRREEVPAETIAAESDIYRKQVEGKPANIIDKIVAGKLEKFYSQVCLLEQAFVKDQDKTVAQVLAETGKAAGDEFTVRRFVRWQLGA